MAGYTAHMGGAHVFGQQYEAYNYYVPDSVVHTIPRINDYFSSLIRESKVEEKDRRYWNIYDWYDLAISLLNRIEYRLQMKLSFLIGDQAISAVPWAVVGEVTSRRIYRHHFPTIESLIDSYLSVTKSPCRTLPVSIYHRNGKRWMKDLRCRGQYNDNQLMSAAILFLADVIRNAGPQTDVFYDVFTNDRRATSEKMSHVHWNVARNASLLRSEGLHKKNDVTVTYVQPPYRKEEPRHWKVKITEKAVALYETGTLTKFENILDPAAALAAAYAARMQEYYDDWM